MAESPKKGMPTTPLMQGFQNPNEMWDPTPLCTIFRTQWFFVAGPPKARKGRHWPGIGCEPILAASQTATKTQDWGMAWTASGYLLLPA